MLPYFSEEFGNPSSGLHPYGRRADQAVEAAREKVGSLIGSSAQEIIFTSGATESNNLVIHGLTRNSPSRRRIITTAVEHKAILEPYRVLAEHGFDVVVLPVDRTGIVELAAAEEAINDQTLLVSVQAASNEVGTVQPLADIVKLARKQGAFVHSDAAQAVGKIPFDVRTLDVDFVSISGHKLYGPKGTGSLYTRTGLQRRLTPLTSGGGQELNLRPGTLNVPGIVALGEACRLCEAEMHGEFTQVGALRDEFEKRLIRAIPGLRINGNQLNRLPGNSSLTFPGVDADAIIMNLPELALSTGSACTYGAVEPSYVLTALGLDREAAHSTVRVGLGRFTTRDDIERSSKLIPIAWKTVSALSR
jgi:cysteine desulfurase